MIGKIKAGLRKVKDFVKKNLPSFMVGLVIGGVVVTAISREVKLGNFLRVNFDVGYRVKCAEMSEQMISDVIQDCMWAVQNMGPDGSTKVSIDQVTDVLWDAAVHPFEMEQSPGRATIDYLLNV